MKETTDTPEQQNVAQIHQNSTQKQRQTHLTIEQKLTDVMNKIRPRVRETWEVGFGPQSHSPLDRNTQILNIRLTTNEDAIIPDFPNRPQHSQWY